jgi:hypothetical protein
MMRLSGSGRQRCDLSERPGESFLTDRLQRGKASITIVHDMPSGVIPGRMRWSQRIHVSASGALANIASPRKQQNDRDEVRP